MSQQGSIDSVLQETRVFPPPAEFSAKAHVGSMEAYEALCKEADADPEGFWARIAEELHWFKKWDKVLEWKAPATACEWIVPKLVKPEGTATDTGS